MKLLTILLFSFISINGISQINNKQIESKFLIGKWISVNDKKYTIVISDSIREYYDRKLTDTFSYQLEKGKLTKISSKGEIYEYDLMGLNKNHLTLMYLSKGNLLKFKRL
jgi:hypothetical protein